MNRALSILVGSLAYLVPPIWAFFAIEADRKEQLAAGHVGFCGNPMLGIICLAGIASATLSLVAACFGLSAFRGVPKPRSIIRTVELGFLFLPFLVVGSYVAVLFLG